jgi:hypothetical protein
MSNHRIIQRGRVSEFSDWGQVLDAWRIRCWPWWRNAVWLIDVGIDCLLED